MQCNHVRISPCDGKTGMLMQRTDRHVYVALALAIAAAILSAENGADPYRQVRLLLLANAAEAVMAAGAIGEDPDAITPP
jgi:hypothetical protein